MEYKYFNIIKPENLLLGKLEYENIKNEKIELTDLVNKLDFSKNIFTYNNDGNVKYLPYSILDNKENRIVYYISNSENDNIADNEFKKYIENIDNIKLKEVTTEDILNKKVESLEFYIIKNGKMYIYE